MIRSESKFKFKALTVYGVKNFCNHANSLDVSIFGHHVNVLYFVSIFCVIVNVNPH